MSEKMTAMNPGIKPNIITVFVGGGNTIAGDEKSLTLFFDVLYDMIQKNKQPETVVICACIRESIAKINIPVIEKYGFVTADVSLAFRLTATFRARRLNSLFRQTEKPKKCICR